MIDKYKIVSTPISLKLFVNKGFILASLFFTKALHCYVFFLLGIPSKPIDRNRDRHFYVLLKTASKLMLSALIQINN